MPSDPTADFLAALMDALERGVLAKLTLSRPRRKDEAGEGIRQVIGRPVRLKAGPRLQLVFRYPTRDLTRNLGFEEVEAAVSGLLGESFTEAHLHGTEGVLHLVLHPGRPPRLHRGPPAHAKPAAVVHDRQKQRAFSPDPRWLSALGITGADGRVLRGKEAKLQQVHRFAELLDGALRALPAPEDGRLRLVDMGSGKGYLAFAAYELLRQGRFPQARVQGVEQRPALVETCNQAALACGFEGLSFVTGRIGEVPLEGADVVVALHACDTATDDALAAAMEAGARAILVAPCCHKELRPQMQPPPVLEMVLKHGILRTREAEIATDALRAALLESQGYSARVFEFIDAEHTARNLMITAIRKGPPDAEALARARELARFYGIRQQRLAGALELSLSAS